MKTNLIIANNVLLHFRILMLIHVYKLKLQVVNLVISLIHKHNYVISNIIIVNKIKYIIQIIRILEA